MATTVNVKEYSRSVLRWRSSRWVHVLFYCHVLSISNSIGRKPLLRLPVSLFEFSLFDSISVFPFESPIPCRRRILFSVHIASDICRANANANIGGSSLPLSCHQLYPLGCAALSLLNRTRTRTITSHGCQKWQMTVPSTTGPRVG